MKRISIISIIFLGLLTSAGTSYKSETKQNFDTNAKMKAVFVYNFTRYIDWPEEYKQGNFVIGLLGETPISEELGKVAATKKAVNQTIEVKNFDSIGNISECHILYVSSNNSADLAAALQKTKGRSTLVITEQDGLAAKGAGISFKVEANRQKFEISKGNIETRKMTVGAALLSLAIVVD